MVGLVDVHRGYDLGFDPWPLPEFLEMSHFLGLDHFSGKQLGLLSLPIHSGSEIGVLFRLHFFMAGYTGLLKRQILLI